MYKNEGKKKWIYYEGNVHHNRVSRKTFIIHDEKWRNRKKKKKKNEMHLIPQNWMLACLKVSAHNHKKRCSDEHGNRKGQERNDKSGSC